MNISDILNRLFPKKQRQPRDRAEMQQPNPAMIQKIMGMLENTQEIELTCDEVFAVLDQFVELAARGEDVSNLLPLVERHLSICADCKEEYDTLKRMMAGAV
ncbi:MAG: hypothetical protein PHQ36_02005 [Anaerolineales bacterium]|nr:hypothetical protein [Anaerolineales bacterium]